MAWRRAAVIRGLKKTTACGPWIEEISQSSQGEFRSPPPGDAPAVLAAFALSAPIHH
jgi:hypothetical protein